MSKLSNIVSVVAGIGGCIIIFFNPLLGSIWIAISVLWSIKAALEEIKVAIAAGGGKE